MNDPLAPKSKARKQEIRTEGGKNNSASRKPPESTEVVPAHRLREQVLDAKPKQFPEVDKTDGNIWYWIAKEITYARLLPILAVVALILLGIFWFIHFQTKPGDTIDILGLKYTKQDAFKVVKPPNTSNYRLPTVQENLQVHHVAYPILDGTINVAIEDGDPQVVRLGGANISEVRMSARGDDANALGSFADKAQTQIVVKLRNKYFNDAVIELEYARNVFELTFVGRENNTNFLSIKKIESPLVHLRKISELPPLQ